MKNKIDIAAAEQAALPRGRGLTSPELILKVTLASPVQEDSWRVAGLRVLAQDPGNILVIFADDTDLRLFHQRLSQYQQGTPPGRKALRLQCSVCIH